MSSPDMTPTTDGHVKPMADTISPVKQAAALLASMDTKDLRYMKYVAQQYLSKSCQFLDDLPPEVRLRIYELVLVEEPDTSVDCKVWTADHESTSTQELIMFDPDWVEPGLLRTCKQVRAEALPVYLEGNVFFIECYGFDPTALVRFYRNAKSATRKHRQIRILIELDGGGLDKDAWRHIWQWLRMYHKGSVPYRPRTGIDQGTGSRTPKFHGIISALFDMLEKLKKANCPWRVVKEVLEDAVAGAEAVTDWGRG